MRITPINNISNISFLNNKKDIKEVTSEVTEEVTSEEPKVEVPLSFRWQKLITVPDVPKENERESDNDGKEGRKL